MEYIQPTTVYEGGTRNVAIGNARAVATTKLPVYSGHTLAILDPAKPDRSVSDIAVNALEINRAHRIADYHEEYDLRYTLRAALYHLNRVIDQYAWACRLFDELHPDLRSGRTGNTSNQALAFEVDATLSAARRIYESLRKVIWKHYRPEGVDAASRWRSFDNMLKTVDTTTISPDCADILKHSWNSSGRRLKAYRDCLSHADALDDGGNTCWLTQQNGRWHMTYKLPANPEAKSHYKFDFENGPDSLTYCWEMVTHLVKITETVAKEEKIAEALGVNPN